MAKEQLREKYKKIRLEMSRDEVEKKSRIICQKLLSEVSWSEIGSIRVYKPIAKLNEVDIERFLSELRDKHPKIKIGVAGSIKNQKLPAQEFDLIIVPALAFDIDGYRLGWGGGWYDRFLADQPKALKIGLCFQNGLVKAGLPRKPHDIQLDKVVTEV